MLRAPKRPVALVAGLLLLVAAGTQPQPPAPPPALAGPLAPLAAQVQWVRAHSALAQGQGARAFVLMRSAVALEPASTSAWTSSRGRRAESLRRFQIVSSPDPRAIPNSSQLLIQGVV